MKEVIKPLMSEDRSKAPVLAEAGKQFAKALRTLLVLLLLILLVVGVLGKVIRAHWSLGLVFSVVLTIAVVYGIQDFRSHRLERMQGIFAATLMVFLLIVIFSAISLALYMANVAQYNGFETTNVDQAWMTISDFISFYTWQFFKVIPGLEVNNALEWNNALKPSGFVAGAIIVAFRVVVIFVLLKAIKDWWTALPRHAAIAKKDSTTQ